MNERLGSGKQRISLAPKRDGVWKLGAADVTDVVVRTSTRGVVFVHSAEVGPPAVAIVESPRSTG